MKESSMCMVLLQAVVLLLQESLWGLPVNDHDDQLPYSFRWQALSHSFETCDCKTASKQPKFACMQIRKQRDSKRSNDALLEADSQRETIVPDMHCGNITRPFTMGRPCPEQCPHEWVIEQFSACSKECGKGVQTRKVKCGNRLHRGYTAPNEFLCHTSLLPKPISTRTCAHVDCPPHFVTSDWSQECHALSTNTYCGIGYNVRSLGCEQVLANSITVQSSGCSEEHKPDMFRDCYKPCPGLAFDATLMTTHTKLNESGQYFLQSRQKIILDCSSAVSTCQQKLVSTSSSNQILTPTITWKFNGEMVDAKSKKETSHHFKNLNDDDSKETENNFQFEIDDFQPEDHMGRYECIPSANIPHQCHKTMQFNLIHISETILKTTDYWSTRSDSTSEQTTSADASLMFSYTASQDSRGCSPGIPGQLCSLYKWRATDWSEDCYPLLQDLRPSSEVNISETEVNSSFAVSSLCIGSQGRFVWCALESDPSEHLPASKCDSASRPASVRQCVLKVPC